LSNALFKEIRKMILIIAIPMAILLLVFFNDKPVIAIAFLIGMFLGSFRLKALFSYLGCLLENEVAHNNAILMIRYVMSMFITLGLVGYALYKSEIVGLSLLFGLIVVPIIITIYALWQGISLYRKN